jgi:putative toxin-antitoxin system antitoxin component (TIGR02293 family)
MPFCQNGMQSGTMKKAKARRRASSSGAKPRPAKRPSRPATWGERDFPGFRSPATPYHDRNDNWLLWSIPEGHPVEDHVEAPATRAAPPALRSLEARGYSQDEIFSLVVPKRTFARRVKRREPLTVEETDRALRLARVAELAERIFGDKEKAHRWLRKPNLALGRATPLTYLASEAGARMVEEMLWQIDSGFLA